MKKAKKAIRTEEGVFRVRRGNLVRIPDAWVGHCTTRQAINKRISKLARRGRPRPLERMKVRSEDDVDNHLRRTGKRWDRRSK